MIRKCPKNRCDSTYLRRVKELAHQKKKEMICLKCQHTWTSSAAYVQKITVATSDELASLAEIADELYKTHKREKEEILKTELVIDGEGQPQYLNISPEDISPEELAKLKRENFAPTLHTRKDLEKCNQ